MSFKAQNISESKRSLAGLYVIGILSTAIGLTVIVILNMFTPLEYILDQLNPGAPGDHFLWGRIVARRFFGLLFLIALSSCLLVAIMHRILKPLAAFLSHSPHEEIPGPSMLKARQRLLNLPFMMIPVNF
ncbi:MAG: hypothetical protein LJE94_14610, partial [Deltaproteobacteria bacterium]|nr:hypothetical protein [Deltaproteobacteria bacterium]